MGDKTGMIHQVWELAKAEFLSKKLDVVIVFVLASIFRNATCHHISGSPCSLKVETSGNTINVKYFACKIQVRDVLAFERILVYAVQGNSSASDELILESSTAINLIVVVGKDINDFV